MRLIDADVLKKDLEPYGLAKGCTLGSHSGMAEILIDIVEKQPTIDAGPVRHGKWEPDEKASDGFAIVKCSRCGYSTYAIAHYVEYGSYCPYCGAKMDGD